jgi:hypothetical protein
MSLGITVVTGGPLLRDRLERRRPMEHPLAADGGGRREEGGGMMRVPVHKGIGDHSAPAVILAGEVRGA